MFKALNNSFFRYILVGLLNTAFGFGVIWFCLKGLQLDYWISTFIGNLLGLFLSFWLNKGFTFRFQGTKRHLPILIKFIGISLGVYFIAYGSAPFLMSIIFPSNFRWVELFTIGSGITLYTGLSYLGHKMITFHNKIL